MNDLQVLKLENEWFAVSVLPEVGAKILTLYDKASQRQILWQNPRIRPQTYPIDANFDNYWCGGWDDAYPTADACVHAGEPFPNLGELRSLAWQVQEHSAHKTTMAAYGPISPVHVIKSIWLSGRVLHMSFAIESLSPNTLDFMWGTHPAFVIEAGTRLIIPAGVGIVAQSSHEALGTPGDDYNWPHINGTDMSVVPDFSAGVNCGHYATDLEDGWFAVETDGRGVLYEFPLEKCPCLWMWLVYGGWRGHYHAVIEPWTGYPVNLAQAFQEDRHSELAPGGTFTVTIRCTTYQAPETHLAALKRLRAAT